MSVIRRRYTANFTTIANVLFEDERLAADEVGILAYLRSRPHDWEVRRPALQRRWKMGRDAIKRVIGNLVRTGWCVARKDRLPDGTFCMIYEIRDEPGPTLSDDEVRAALSLVSSGAAPDEIDGEPACGDVSGSVDPPTPYPSLADPPPADPPLAYIDIQNKELPRKDSTQNPEREGAREKPKHALNLAEFKKRYPTAVSDDQVKIDNAWSALTPAEGEEAIKGIPPFLDRLKRDHKKYPPAAFNYLLQKRWVLLDGDGAVARIPTMHARDSVEARALDVLFKVAHASSFFYSVMRRGGDGSVSYPKEVTPKLAKLADAGPETGWPELDRQQAAAWEGLLKEFVTVQLRKHLVAGDRAPWLWPPRKDGTLSTAGPETLMSEDDFQNI